MLDISFDGWHLSFRNTKEENGEIVNTLDRKDTSYEQKGLGPGLEYEVKLEAVKNKTHGPPAIETVTTKLDGPGQVEVRDITDTSAIISWHQPVALIDGFALSYGPSTDDSARNTADLTQTETQYSLERLSPDTEYEVAVLSRRGEMRSDPVLEKFTTELDAPTDLEAVDQTDSTVTLEWKNSKAAVESYQVKYSTLDGAEHGAMHFLPSAGDITLATISGLSPGTEYGIGVSAVKEDRESLPATTNAATNLDAPKDLEVSESTDSTLTVVWKKPVADIGAYRLIYFSTDGSMEEVEIPATETSHTLTQLTPGTLNTMSLVAKRGNQKSEPATLTASTDLDAPKGLEVSESTDTSMTVVWKKPVAEIGACQLIYFSTDGSMEEVEIPATDTSYTLTQLTPGTLYTMSLVAKKGSQKSEPATLTASTDLDAPKNLKVSESTETTLSVVWKKPVAEIDAYQLIYFSMDSSIVKVEIPGTETSYTLTQLTPGTLYTMSLVANRGSQRSEPATLTASTAPELTRVDVVALSIKMAPTPASPLQEPDSAVTAYDSLKNKAPTAGRQFGGPGDEPETSGVGSLGEFMATVVVQTGAAETNVAPTQASPMGTSMVSHVNTSSKISMLNSTAEPNSSTELDTTTAELHSTAKMNWTAKPTSMVELNSQTELDSTVKPTHMPEPDSMVGSTTAYDAGAMPTDSWISTDLNSTSELISTTELNLTKLTSIATPTVELNSTVEVISTGKPNATARPSTTAESTTAYDVVTVPTDTWITQVNGLSSSTLYDINVYGTPEGEGNRFLPTMAPPVEHKPLLGNLTITDLSWDSFNVTWSPEEADYDAFLIEIAELEGGLQVANYTLAGDAQNVAVSGLNPSTSYRLILYGVHKGEVLEPAFAEVTTETEPMVSNLYVSNVTSESFVVSWNGTEGNFEGFVLEIFDTSWLMEPVEYNLSHNALSYEITGLNPSTYYIAYLYRVIKGVRTPAVSTVATTAEEPDLARLVVSNITSDRLTLSWRTAQRRFDHFVVELRESAAPLRALGRTLPGRVRSTVIAGLKESTSYEIKLYASAGGRNTAALLASATTEAAPLLGTLNVSDITPSSFLVSWNTVAGHFDSFVIRVSDSEQLYDTLDLTASGDAREVSVAGLVDSTHYDVILFGVSHGRRTPSISAQAQTGTT
ncbi:hypothetical protein GJAV_G00038900 [Gymnothorax javanicus]|nr:hypothetical protein GJAV_G00038900 [Gymnothorax javanicus]